MATPVRPAAAAPPACPPQPQPLPPPPPLLHHDTTLTLAPPPFVCAISPRPQHARRQRRPDGVASSSALARVRSSSLSPTGTGDDTPQCTECGKRFPSCKALFGHMRCHPERQWRGITPPPHFRHHQAQAQAAAAAADQHFTSQEREIAASLLMLAGARHGGAGKGKKSTLGAKERNSTSISSPTSAPAPPPSCDDDGHKCSVCARGFATGQALGGHKRCHWERACGDGTMVQVVPTPSGCSASATSSEAAATTLDLNLPPPGTMPLLPQKSDDQQGGGSLESDTTLDLKLGY